MHIQTLPISQIAIQDRLRSGLDEQAVEGLMDSIKRLGVTELPCVRWIGGDNDRAALVFGAHRIEAMRRLGHEWITCRIFEGDETEARLLEIAENLFRAELTPDVRDAHIREWFRLTGEEKPGAGARFAEGGRGNKGGVADFAREFNLPRTTVREALDLGNLDPAVKEQADAAGLTRKERLEVVRTAGSDPEQQIRAVDAIVQRGAPVNVVVTPEEPRAANVVDYHVERLAAAASKAAAPVNVTVTPEADMPTSERERLEAALNAIGTASVSVSTMSEEARVSRIVDHQFEQLAAAWDAAGEAARDRFLKRAGLVSVDLSVAARHHRWPCSLSSPNPARIR